MARRGRLIFHSAYQQALYLPSAVSFGVANRTGITLAHRTFEIGMLQSMAAAALERRTNKL